VKRRQFITLLGGAAAAWPLVAHAQQQPMPIIAVLGGALNNAEGQARIKAFTETLQDLGRIEGRNIRLDIRLAGDESRPDTGARGGTGAHQPCSNIGDWNAGSGGAP